MRCCHGLHSPLAVHPGNDTSFDALSHDLHLRTATVQPINLLYPVMDNKCRSKIRHIIAIERKKNGNDPDISHIRGCHKKGKQTINNESKN